MVYQTREEGDERVVFICNTDRDEPCPVEISLRGECHVEGSAKPEVVLSDQVLDTLTGESWAIKSSQGEGRTTFKYCFDGCQSVLLHLTPGSASSTARNQIMLRRDFMQLADISLVPFRKGLPQLTR